jgi:hypothetical protein
MKFKKASLFVAVALAMSAGANLAYPQELVQVTTGLLTKIADGGQSMWGINPGRSDLPVILVDLLACVGVTRSLQSTTRKGCGDYRLYECSCSINSHSPAECECHKRSRSQQAQADYDPPRTDDVRNGVMSLRPGGMRVGPI